MQADGGGESQTQEQGKDELESASGSHRQELRREFREAKRADRWTVKEEKAEARAGRRAERVQERRDRRAARLSPELPPEPPPEPPPGLLPGEIPAGDPYGDDGGYHDWGQSIYLSNDDTMSLSSAQRVLFSIDHFLPLPPDHIRPHELLNYFSFDLAEVGATDNFGVLAGFAPNPAAPNLFSLALAVRGLPFETATRRNAQLSLVIDRSGSMAEEGRMEYLKRGLLQMSDQLKRGDIVHLTVFDHRVCVPIRNFVVGRDNMSVLTSAIQRLRPEGATDLHAGLTRGYELADAAYHYCVRLVAWFGRSVTLGRPGRGRERLPAS
ncbi:MAG: VWA domain-containing protein, partial [Polyangiaceae bacterium]|nr:VWA domain-containing protein [Polyangiaceae bacterium]